MPQKVRKNAPRKILARTVQVDFCLCGRFSQFWSDSNHSVVCFSGHIGLRWIYILPIVMNQPKNSLRSRKNLQNCSVNNRHDVGFDRFWANAEAIARMAFSKYSRRMYLTWSDDIFTVSASSHFTDMYENIVNLLWVFQNHCPNS